MRLGCFGKSGQIEMIEKAGFDSAELDIGELEGMSETEYDELRRRVEASPLTFEVFSGLLPLSVRIFADDFDEEYWLRYIQKGVERAAGLGAEYIPFGAGKCRSVPVAKPAGSKTYGEEIRPYEEKLLRFIRAVCDILAKYEITLVIEPLGPANSNYLNRIDETAAFAKKTGCSNCRIMCDLRHMVKNGEKLDEIYLYRGDILHAHIDYPLGEKRLFPQEDDGYDYRPYIRELKKAGHTGLLTIEATDYADFSLEAQKSAQYLRSIM